jgi:hypothetical protein
MEEQKPRLSNFEVEEKAAEAESILDNPVLKEALDSIHSRALGTLTAEDVGSLTAAHAHAMIKAITELREQLKQYIADHKVRQKYNKGDK